MSPITPICMFCKNLSDDPLKPLSCKAFERIPDKYIDSEELHLKSENGEPVFEPVDDEAELYLKELLSRINDL